MDSIKKKYSGCDSTESVFHTVKEAGTLPAKAGRLLPAFTLIELVISMCAALIVILSTGILLVSGNRIWFNTYASVHSKIKQDAISTMLAFGKMGRMSNRLNYRIYKVSGDTLTPALPASKTDVEVVSGDAVEFRYWDVELDSSDSHNLLDPDKTATAYALFYLDGSVLKIDYGPYPPGAAPDGGGIRNTAGITTMVLAENITKPDKIGAFSHTVDNNVGKGCVRIDVTLSDPDNKESVKVMTASMMRNIWPR
jgi:hypothetical protein